MENKFFGKSVVFISVAYFGLEKQIEEGLRSNGAKVISFDERPSNNSIIKGIIRTFPSILKFWIKLHFKHIIKSTNKLQVDYLYVNKGETVTPDFLRTFRKSHPKALFIYYTWDSMINNPNALKIIQYFDRKFTFDYKDSKNHRVQFFPLFYSNSCSDYNQNYEGRKKRILFIGTAHSDRYEISQKVLNIAVAYGFESRAFYYINSYLVYLLKRLFDKGFKRVSRKDLFFTPLTEKELFNEYCEADIIIDIQHPKQTGLTKRTFEVIGARKKLITTNQDILNYRFYSSNNIAIISRNNIEISEEFWSKAVEPYMSDFEEIYLLNNWLKYLFFEEFSLKSFRSNSQMNE